MSEEIKETPTGELEQGEFKIKKKPGRPKKLNKKDEPTKLDLSKKEEPKKEEQNAISESRTGSVDEKTSTPSMDKVEEKVRELPTTESQPQSKIEEKILPSGIIEEITEPETKTSEEVNAQIKEEVKENPQIQLPENIEKLVDFMKDTGGNIEDYVRLNADYSTISESALLDEYYKNTRPHLEPDEVKFLMEDKFSFDEEVEEERDIKRKKLAYKEEIAKAKSFLEETKKKYYDEIKLRPGVTQDQQKATDFFNRYNKEQSEIQKHHDQFKHNTKDYFNQDFKGFEFNLGEKKFRYNVNDINGVVENQSALTNFTKKFLNKDGSVNDLQGYHKALYTAQHADNIANHFYEQGKADATKNIMAKSKNIHNESRKEPSGDIFINGLKVKAINGVDSSKLKIKKRKIT